jgi:hypothetical protein
MLVPPRPPKAEHELLAAEGNPTKLRDAGVTRTSLEQRRDTLAAIHNQSPTQAGPLRPLDVGTQEIDKRMRITRRKRPIRDERGASKRTYGSGGQNAIESFCAFCSRPDTGTDPSVSPPGDESAVGSVQAVRSPVSAGPAQPEAGCTTLLAGNDLRLEREDLAAPRIDEDLQPVDIVGSVLLVVTEGLDA